MIRSRTAWKPTSSLENSMTSALPSSVSLTRAPQSLMISGRRSARPLRVFHPWGPPPTTFPRSRPTFTMPVLVPVPMLAVPGLYIGHPRTSSSCPPGLRPIRVSWSFVPFPRITSSATMVYGIVFVIRCVAVQTCNNTDIRVPRSPNSSTREASSSLLSTWFASRGLTRTMTRGT